MPETKCQKLKSMIHNCWTVDQKVPDWILFWSSFTSRCYLTIIIKILTSLALACLNLESFQSAARFKDDPGEQYYNKEFVDSRS